MAKADKGQPAGDNRSGGTAARRSLAGLRLQHEAARGAAEMAAGNHGRAAARYAVAIELLRSSGSGAADPAQLVRMLCNRSRALLAAGSRATEALADADAAARLAPHAAKPRWRRAKALAGLSRHPESLLAFLDAWRLSQHGTVEQRECAAQLRQEANRLTVQQLADMLLQEVLATQHEAPPPAQQLLTDAADSHAGEQGSWAVVQPQQQQPQQQQQQAPQQVAREAMYLLVKQQRTCKQALLLRWLMQCSNSSSSSGTGKQEAAAAVPAMLQAEVQVLSAQLAVKQQAWASARQAALAAESKLAQLVTSDHEQLLQLLLDCYATLAEACMAGSSSRGAANPQARPAEAARACLMGLHLLPPPAPGGPAAAMTCQLQHLLSSALEQLDDAGQAAVWAAAPATVLAEQQLRNCCSSDARQLACMQLDLGVSQASLLLATLTITTAPCSESVPAAAMHRGALAGADRVLMLSGLARAANVQQMAVSIAGVQGVPGVPCSVLRITFKVQFLASERASAAAFMRHTGSISSLIQAWPELQRVLPVPAECCQLTAVLSELHGDQGSESPDPSLVNNTQQQHMPRNSRGAVVTAPMQPLVPALPLPYAGYSLVTVSGAPLERPSKHPFVLTRVVYEARDAPCEVWYEPAGGGYRWRQSASEVQLQLQLPAAITRAAQLCVLIEPYELCVAHAAGGQVYLHGSLVRGVVPADSTWTLEHSGAARGGGATAADGGGGRALVAHDADGAAGEGGLLLLTLAKMNLELYESPHQPSASWWPRLFEDDPADIAYDDEPKDFSDLPAAIAAAAAEAEAANTEQWRDDARRRHEREQLQRVLQRRKRDRAVRLQQLKRQQHSRR